MTRGCSARRARSAAYLGRALTMWATVGCLVQVVAQTHFATLATDGAWTWYNDPRAIFHNGKLYFGYVRAANGKSALNVFDLSTGESSNLWYSGFTQTDDHNVPALCSKEDGTLLAIYSRHISDHYFAYRTSISANPVTGADWNPEQQSADSGAGMTYANPFQLTGEGGKIYNFCRNLNFNPTLYTSTDGGSTWSSPQLFIRTGSGGTIRPYVKYCSDHTNRIDFLYTDGHPRDVTNSLYHLYYEGGAFYKTDGTRVKFYVNLPIDHDAGERGSVIYQYSDTPQSDPNQWIPTGRAWCWEIANDTNGHPVCVFTVQRDLVAGSTSGTDDRIYYYYARWTGTDWQKRFIAHAGRPLYVAEDDYAGGICLDPQDPSVIYLSSNAGDPFNLSLTNTALNANQRYELWKGVTSDGGLTFDWTPVTTNSAVDNLRPYVPRRYGGEPCVLWFRGTYSSYTSYSCSIVGLFTTDVPTPVPPPLITYVDATAGGDGNTALAAGGAFNPQPESVRSGTDGLWCVRSFGNGATAFESGGDLSTAGTAVNGDSEDSPRLATAISGLVPGASYEIYAYFWGAGYGQDWRLRAGLTNTAGDLPLFTDSSQPTAMGSDFAVAPLILEADRSLQQASLGIAVANGSGTVTAYIDDDPAARAGIADGWQFRSWFDGVGYALSTAAYPTNLSSEYDPNADTLTLSWPASHLGWVLQRQTTSLATGLTAGWADVEGSWDVTSTNLHVSPTDPAVFFRLRHP